MAIPAYFSLLYLLFMAFATFVTNNVELIGLSEPVSGILLHWKAATGSHVFVVKICHYLIY